MIKNKPHSVPLYRQAAQRVLARLQKNEWQEGEALPNEFELATQHQVSQGTMRKALDVLVEEGLLFRRQGAGTFVAACLDSVGEASAALLVDSAVKEKIRFEYIGLAKVHANEQMASELAVRRGCPVWQITRLLRVGGSLFGLDQAFLPEARFPELSMKLLRQDNANLTRICRINFGLYLTEREVRYRAVMPGIEEIKILQADNGVPFLERIRVMHDTEGQPVLCGITMLKTNDFAFCPYIRNI